VDRLYSVSTKKFIDDGNGNVKALQLVTVEMKNIDGQMRMVEVEGSEKELPCDLALLAMGFVGSEKPGMLEQLGVELDTRGNVVADSQWMTSVDGVFVAGDMQRGQSLIVWAIAEGRSVARSVDEYLMGSSELPAPVTPNS
jgi:glutamate synthase (NADPH/NADH) small chain